MSASGPVFTLCVPGRVFGVIECVGSCFQVWRSRKHFRCFRGHRVPFSSFAIPDAFLALPFARFLFSCFALTDTLSALPSASGPVFTLCVPGRVFGVTECVGSRFHVLRTRTRFRRFRVHRVPLSRFAHPDTFLAFSRVSGPVFTFCAPGCVFGVADLVGSRFQVLRSRTRFRCYQARRVPFSRFTLPDVFSTVPSSSGPVCTFCAPGHVRERKTPVFMFCANRCVFDVSECVGTRSGTSFRRNRVCRVPFSRFALSDAFLVFSRSSGPILNFALPDAFSVLPSASGPISCFALPNLFSVFPRSSGPDFKYCDPGRIFGVTVFVRYHFHVLRSQKPFRRYRVHRVPFSRFAFRDAFSAPPSPSSPVFKFYAPGPVFEVTACIGSRFHVLRSRTRFRRSRVCRIMFSNFALPIFFLTFRSGCGPAFMFGAPGFVFGMTEYVGSRFHVLRTRTCFRSYGVRRVPFSRFALPNAFSAIPRASCPIFIF